MKNRLIVIILFCVMVSCKREYDKSKFGPEVIVVPENFEVVDFTIQPSNSINLASTDPFFSCTMPQKAEFKIEIKGLLSDAVKTIRGTGQYIDITNSSWTGDSDNISIFRSGESCAIELSFRGAIKKYYDTITITNGNVYENTFVINDFEGITFDKNGPNMATYGNYFDAGDLAVTDIRTDNSLKPCQGSQSVEFDGQDSNNSFYVGGMYFFPPTATYTFDTYSPDSLYLNAYIYSYGDQTTNMTFSFAESDGDSWKKDLLVEGKGWSLVSYKLKDFIENNITVGDGLKNLDQITGFNMNVGARTAGLNIHVNVDYITITYGRPFEP